MSTTIQCPNCGTQIDVNEILSHELEEKLKQENSAKQREIEEGNRKIESKLNKELKKLATQKKSIEEQNEQFNEKLKIATKEKLKIEKEKLRDKIKKEITAEQSDSMALLQKELDDKSAQVQELNKSKAEVEKLKREKSEVEATLKADLQATLSRELKDQKIQTQRELREAFEIEQKESMALLQKELQDKSEQVKELNNATIEIARLKREKGEISSQAKADAQVELGKMLQEEKEKIAKSFAEQNELKLKAKDEQIEQIKRDFDNAQRKLEQGSMQIQGEALELVIESWIESQFPFDTVEEVKKGAFGADCIEYVNTREIPNCGIICYESKDAKAWSANWISKLKQDMISINADIGVLVTTVYPKDMRRMGFVDGIWVCSLDEFKGSVSLLRESLIRLRQTIKKDENRADKMNLLYDYMTGNEFSMQMKAIVDGFIKMQDELAKEKRSLMASWKRREKTIDGVLANTTEMYGALQGIAGSSAIVHIDALELPEDLEEEG